MSDLGVPNVLADRYASRAMVEIWSPVAKVRLERELWVAVLEAQVDNGIDIPRAAIDAYRSSIAEVDLESIRARERITRHDVKARIEEFNDRSGYEVVHLGMTSRDLTENVEQLQIRRSLELVRRRLLALLARVAERSQELADVVIAARTHNVAAQPTTMGKRLASTGEEMLYALDRLDGLIDYYPLRGIKGPVGTQQDLLDLFDGDVSRVEAVEFGVSRHLGFERMLGSVGQVYPRLLDFDAISTLLLVASGPGNLALLVRLMAGHELITEGFQEGQVGSSAMPHKMNTRSSERVNGMVNILRGHVSMAAGLVADQWNEGDVSCSVVRRVVLPDAFLTIDGLIETTLEVVGNLGVYPAVIEAELARYLPFLASTRLLIAGVKAGLGREVCHEIVKEHATAAARHLRMSGAARNDLPERLGSDPRYPLDVGAVQLVIAGATSSVGRASSQVSTFVADVEARVSTDPEAASYRGSAVL